MWDRIEKTMNMHGATAHVLIHTYATMAAGTGIDPKTLQSIMRRADIQTTMNRYAHNGMDKIEEVKETLKKHVFATQRVPKQENEKTRDIWETQAKKIKNQFVRK